MKKNFVNKATVWSPPSSLTVFLTGLVFGILLLSAESSLYRVPLCSGAISVAGLGCWQRWRFSNSIKWSLFPAIAGVLFGLTTTFWSTQQIGVALQKQATLASIFSSGQSQRYTKSYESFSGIVADREDRYGSVRLWIASGVLQGSGWQADGLVQITVYKKAVTAMPGDRVTFKARLYPPRSFRVPGAFDYAKFLLNKGVVATGYAKEPVAPVTTTGQFRINRIRQKISNWISRDVAPDSQGMVEALLVGKRGRLSAKVREALTVSGTFHLIAISGLHLGLVAGWSFFLLRLFITLIPRVAIPYDSKRPAALIAIIPMLAYASLAGWSLSTQRAAVMVGLYLLAVALGRGGSGWRALSIAATLLLLWRPYELFQAGFQLSFIAVAGLLALWPITNFLSPKTEQKAWWQGKVTILLIVTVFMQLATLPVVTHHFHRLTPYGFVGNLIAVPWVSLVSAPFGLLALVGKLIHPTIGEWFLQGMSQSLVLLQQWVEWLS
ncbi:MAG: ComEC family competence protein, partial [Magnetococcales bacterium]|nr:ComEC family competence protein [Magnetococcales bacterium]